MKQQESSGIKAFDVPCGVCWKCRRAQSREWAVRIMHEASLHEKNTFITLTYNNEHLPENGELRKKDFQDFMKRLRKANPELGTLYPTEDGDLVRKIRYYHAGEYGSNFDRPHYHAILFGVEFPDKKYWRKSKNGFPVYRSEILEKAWSVIDPETKERVSIGFSEIGNVTIESASYVAQYCTKKVTGKDAEKYYGGKLPEYATMSRSPAIGEKYYEQNREEIIEQGTVQYIDHRIKIPRLYLKREKSRIAEITNEEEI